MNEIETAYQNGEINDYFYDQLNRKAGFLPPDLFDIYFEEAKNMSNIGISNGDDQKIFFYILTHVQDILRSLVEGYRSNHKIAEVSSIVFENRKELPIDTLEHFYSAVAYAASQAGLTLKDEVLSNLKKKAYPSGIGDGLPRTIYNIEKWVQATRDIYNEGEKIGLSEAFDNVTKNWDIMEKLNFKSFLSFYQEGADKKYKIAQEGSDKIAQAQFAKAPTKDVNYILPPNFPPMLKAKLPEPFEENEEPKPQVKKKPEDVNDARTRIEGQRNRIIGRLNAAEKLLSSLDGQFFAGDFQEDMLRMLQDLKRKVQTANKMTAHSSLFEDYIYRTGNYFNVKGNKKAATFFYKIAQEKDDLLLPDDSGDASPELDLSEEPLEVTDDSAEDPNKSQDMSASPDSSSGTSETEQAFNNFLTKLKEGVSDLDLEDFTSKKAFVVNAQLSPEGNQIPEDEIVELDPNRPAGVEQRAREEAQKAKPEEELVVEEPPSNETIHPANPEVGTGLDLDDAIDAALNDVTIHDVVKRLEILSAFFKKREVPKQLSIIDLMLDRLGIGSFFPALGEATRSALESNSYVSTRIEDILGKLQGALSSNDAEKMFDDSMEPAPEGSERLINNLKQKEQAEEERKELRKQKELLKDQQAVQKPEQAQELAQPVNVQQTPPAIER